jgi:hypothetical protein
MYSLGIITMMFIMYFPKILISIFIRRVEDTKGVIRIRKSKNGQYNGQKKKNKQWSTKHTHKTKDRVTRTPLKPGVNSFKCSGRVSSSCSTSGTRRVNLVTNPVISHEWGKDREMFTTSEHIHGHLWLIFHNGQPSHGGTRKTFEVMTST